MDFQWHPLNAGVAPETTLRSLWNQGVQGLALTPCREIALPEWLSAQWSNFSVFKSSRGLPDLRFHLVRHSAWDYMMETLNAVADRGYRKVAVLLHASISPRDNLARLGAVLAARERVFASDATCTWKEFGPFLEAADTRRAIQNWLREERPEAVILPYRFTLDLLIDMGFRVPGDFAVACVLTGSEATATGWVASGCDRRETDAYRVCLTQLRELILRKERGFAATPFEHVLQPRWIEGQTLPQAS